MLILGPEVPFLGSGETRQEALRRYLEIDDTDNEKLKYYVEDELFSFSGLPQKDDTYFEIIEFYKELKPDEIYSKIADIPFHAIISLSPDLILKKTFEHKGFRHQFGTYWKGNNITDELEEARKESPIIYNLLGSIQEEESLIFTYNDLFEFFESILSKYPLPHEVRTALQANCFLLLGFRFDKWYLKLLMRILEIHSGRKITYSQKVSVTPADRAFYVDHFRIEFLEYDAKEFIDTLFQECGGGQQSLLRSQNISEYGAIPEEAMGLVDQVKNWVENGMAGEIRAFREEVRGLIENNRLEEAIEQLMAYAQATADSEFSDEILLLKVRFHTAKEDHVREKITYEDYRIIVHRITETLISLTNRVQ